MFRFIALASMAAAAAAPGAALAQSSAQTAAQTAASAPVNIVGQRDSAPRRDVSRVCPAVQTELPEVLASAWQQVGQSGTVRLVFTLDGNRVVDARAAEGPRAYHRWVRMAMSGVTCSSDRSGPQRFELAVRFADPSAPGAHSVALLTP